MTWICQTDRHGYLVGEAAPVSDLAAACPPGWIFVEAEPPAREPGQFARLGADGAWSIDTDGPPAPVAVVPAKVHKLWLIRVLETLDLMDDVEAAMDAAWDAGDKSFKRYWLAASEIYRSDPMLGAFAADRDWSGEQLDAMFTQAAAYEAALAS